MAVLVSILSLCATLLGGLVAMRVRDQLHLVLGAAAGIMLGVVLFDLLPESLAEQSRTVWGVPAPMLTCALGFLTLHVVEKSTAVHQAHEDEYGPHQHSHQRIGLVAGGALVLHSTLDGFGIGLAFQSGESIGITVAIAVIAHDIADGFNTFTVTSLYGNTRRKALALLGMDAVAPVVGAVLGTVVRLPSGALGLYLGFFAGFLLYLATSDILPEAHARHPTRRTLLCTVAGMAFMWLVVGATK